MIFKSFIVSIISIFIYLLLFVLSQYFINAADTKDGTLVFVIFWTIAGVLPTIFGILCVLNYLVQAKLKDNIKRSPDSIYLLYSLLFTLVPIFLFVLFDYSDRGRYFGKKTLLDVMKPYTGIFLLSIFIIFVNRKIVWNNFRKDKQAPATG